MNVFTVKDAAHLRPVMLAVWETVSKGIQGGKPVVVEVKRENRSLLQNAKLWPMLTDISTQIKWHDMELKPEDWKDIFSAALLGQQFVPNLDGTGMVTIGGRTSKMNKAMFSDLVELLYSEGTERGVKWSEKAKACYDEYREAQ